MLLANKTLIRFEEYEIDRLCWTVRWRKEPISLKRKSLDVLLYLIDQRDRVVGKDELLETLWAGQFVEEGNLSQHIFLLRKALSRHETGKSVIETVAGRGYRFVAQLEEEMPVSSEIVITASKSVAEFTVEVEEAGVPELASSPIEVVQARRSPPRVSRSLYWIAGGCAVMAALCVAGWFGWQRWLDHTSGSPVEVVLTSLEGTTGDQILDRALVDALRMDLVQSPFISVVAPARVRATLTDMKQKPDDPMSTATAREVCERTNSQAVLHGSVARAGQHFLITEQAASCVNGSILAEAIQQASSPEDLPHAIDKLAASLRQKLGESRRTIARFDTPVFSSNTASLEALKDYTQAETQSDQGKFADAIALMKKAVAADPSFAEGYYNLAAFYRNTLDSASEREAVIKAYSLRDSATEPIRLAIIALYHSAATQDLYESEQNYRTWTELYPRSAQAWNGLSVVDRDLGRHNDALVAAAHALELRPNVLGVYTNLAFEQMQTGDVKGSLSTCERALAKGLDGDYLRQHYFESAYLLHDAALVQKQREWTAAHPDAIYVRIEELEIAIAEGRFADAHNLLPQINVIMRRQGLSALADFYTRAEAVNLIEAGDRLEGLRLLQGLPVELKDEIGILALARMGEFATAESSLHAMQTEFPQGTIWNDYRTPQIHAIIALATHKPKDAITALERARALEGRDPIIPMLRADAYLANSQPELAEKSYRQVVEGPDQSPETIEVPLSWLGLGRSLAAEGKRSAAIDAYKHFLVLWDHADRDALNLVQARQELASLLFQSTRP